MICLRWRNRGCHLNLQTNSPLSEIEPGVQSCIAVQKKLCDNAQWRSTAMRRCLLMSWISFMVLASLLCDTHSETVPFLHTQKEKQLGN